MRTLRFTAVMLIHWIHTPPHLPLSSLPLSLPVSLHPLPVSLLEAVMGRELGDLPLSHNRMSAHGGGRALRRDIGWWTLSFSNLLFRRVIAFIHERVSLTCPNLSRRFTSFSHSSRFSLCLTSYISAVGASWGISGISGLSWDLYAPSVSLPLGKSASAVER